MNPMRLFLVAAGALACMGEIAVVRAAESSIGTVAALQGSLELQRGKAWTVIGSGDDIPPGARLRTGPAARAKIVFRDDSVLDLGAASELAVESFETQAAKRQVVMRLNKGRVHVWVSDQYRQPKARFEIETPTAIAGAHGTEFIVVYSPDTELTEVVGIADRVSVVGRLAVLSGGVEVGPNGYTQVQKGKFPTASQALDDTRFQSFFEGLELRGTGRRDGLNVEHPLLGGRLPYKDDVPATAVATQEPLADGSGRPLPPASWRYSPDVYTNRQPLRQYQRVSPGFPPPAAGPGGVHVEF